MPAPTAVIWKYTIALEEIAETNEVSMPIGPRILHVAEQYGKIAFWALVDPHPLMTQEVVSFCIRGTGHSFDPYRYTKYLGTVVMKDGALVLHVFTR
jgi:hypothetical protein